MNRIRLWGAWLAGRKLQDWAHISAIVGFVVGAFALVFQSNQFREQVILEREIAANQSWERYMEMAVQLPKFANGTDYENLDQENRVKYQWFVERMLAAGEQAIEYSEDDPAWNYTILTESSRHISYLQSREFLDNDFCSYDQRMRNLLSSKFVFLKSLSCEQQAMIVTKPGQYNLPGTARPTVDLGRERQLSAGKQ